MRVKTSIFILSLLVIIIEVIFVIFCGKLPENSDPPQFKYQYTDIYDRFFKKIYKRDEYVYIPQRHLNVSIEFPEIKKPNTIRIFIIGGSFALDYSFANHNKKMFEYTFPNKNFEIINCGMGAYDSSRVYLVEKEILSYQPDFIIVFCGNNENIYGKTKVNIFRYYINKFLQRSHLYYKLQNVFLKLYKKQGVSYPRNKKEILVDYNFNMRRIVHIAKQRKVPIILCTLPVNIKFPPSGFSPLDEDFLCGRFLLETGDYYNAIDRLESFLKNNCKNPFGYYFISRAYEKLGKYLNAKKYYLKAIELDSGCRTTSGRNNVIRQICVEEQVPLVDLESKFMQRVPYGLLGKEHFFDYCHIYTEFYSLVSASIIEELMLFSNVVNSAVKKHSIYSYSLPSLNQLGRSRDNVEHSINSAVWEVMQQKGGNNGLLETTVYYLENVYVLNPNSLGNIRYLRNKIKKNILNNAWVLENVSNFDFENNWPQVIFYIGETYRRLGLYAKAIEYFDYSIMLNSSNYFPYLGKALTFYTLGDKKNVLENINKAEELTQYSESNSLEVKLYKKILKL